MVRVGAVLADAGPHVGVFPTWYSACTPNVRKSGMLHLHQIITLQIVEENQQS